jgi:hypothetical protein
MGSMGPHWQALCLALAIVANETEASALA